MNSSNVGLLVSLGEGGPFLTNLNVSGVALLVLSGLLEALVELLVDGSATGHQILLDATQSSEDVVDEVETPLLDMLAITRRESTSECERQKPRRLQSSTHDVDVDKVWNMDLNEFGGWRQE